MSTDFSAFRSEFVKLALIERLVRLGATDIPGTPRMVMKHRNPEQLKALQGSITRLHDQHISSPIMNAAQPALNKLPEGRLRNLATAATRQVASDPVGMIASHAVPVPGASLAYAAGKRGLEHVIDHAFPLPR